MNEKKPLILNISKWLFIITSIIFVIYATITMRGLYMDGSYYMLCSLNGFETGQYMYFFDNERVRFCIDFIIHLPILLANLILGISSKKILIMIYSLTQVLLPLLAIWWNYILTKRTNRRDILYLSLLNYCLVLITYSIFGVSEALIGSTLLIILWNYMCAPMDYSKKDIFFIILLLIIMFGTEEYVIIIGPIFFAASFLYAKREEVKKNKILKMLIGTMSLCAAIFDAVFLLKVHITNPDSASYFFKEFYDFLPDIFNLCILMSFVAVVFLIISMFKRESLSKIFLFTVIACYTVALIELLTHLDSSVNPVWEYHLRSITFWQLPLIFIGIYIFDLLNKQYNPIKINNYIIIVLLCGIFQNIWQCVNTYFWDVNVKYMKNELNSVETPLYLPAEHDEISSFFNKDLRRYIWWANYASMSILLSDTHKVKTLAVNYDYKEDDGGNNPCREYLFVIPAEDIMCVPFEVYISIKNKFWDLTDSAAALDEYNHENSIYTEAYKWE